MGHRGDPPRFGQHEPQARIADAVVRVERAMEELRIATDELRSLQARPPAEINRAFSSIVKRCGRLTLDTSRAVCFWGGDLVPLTKTELSILDVLLTPPGRVFTRDHILDVLEYDHDADDRTIDSLIKRLRARFRAIDPGFKQLRTVYGIGYKWALEDAETEF